MKIGVTLIGLEEILKKEIKGKIVYPGRILFNKENSGASLLVYDYVKSFKFKDENEIYDKISKLKIKKDFRVDCSRIGDHKFSSQDIREKVGEIVHNQGNKVNLKNPETLVYIDIIDDFCIIGLNPEFIGKRKYRVRINNDTLNACLAYSLLKLAKFNPKKVLLDPFCSDGTLLIEAGLLKGKKIYGFSTDVKNASINSKIAKVKLNLYTERLDWISTLLKKDSVDLIISKAPYPSKRKKIEEVESIIRDLFNQALNVLNKKGLMLLISPKIEILLKYAKLYNFKVKEELKIKQGDQELTALSFRK